MAIYCATTTPSNSMDAVSNSACRRCGSTIDLAGDQMIIRCCDGPGCSEEQPMGARDAQPPIADPPWLTVFALDVPQTPPLQFCSRACARLWLAPPVPTMNLAGDDDQ